MLLKLFYNFKLLLIITCYTRTKHSSKDVTWVSWTSDRFLCFYFLSPKIQHMSIVREIQMKKLHSWRHVIAGSTYGMGFNCSIHFLLIMWDQFDCCMNIILVYFSYSLNLCWSWFCFLFFYWRVTLIFFTIEMDV